MAKSVKKTSIWDGLAPEENDVSTHTDTHTHTDTPTQRRPAPPKKVKKDCRIQILTYSDLVKELDDYATHHGMSRAEAFEKAVREYLDNNT